MEGGGGVLRVVPRCLHLNLMMCLYLNSQFLSFTNPLKVDVFLAWAVAAQDNHTLNIQSYWLYAKNTFLSVIKPLKSRMTDNHF